MCRYVLSCYLIFGVGVLAFTLGGNGLQEMERLKS
jgi:hypothetical protein